MFICVYPIAESYIGCTWGSVWNLCGIVPFPASTAVFLRVPQVLQGIFDAYEKFASSWPLLRKQLVIHCCFVCKAQDSPLVSLGWRLGAMPSGHLPPFVTSQYGVCAIAPLKIEPRQGGRVWKCRWWGLPLRNAGGIPRASSTSLE
jgi:hypothetical protein